MQNKKLAHAIKKNAVSIPRLISTSLDNSLVFLTKRKPQRGPLFVVWNITDECNLRCSFCGWWRNSKSSEIASLTPSGFARNDDVKGKLTTAQRIKIVEKLAKSGVWFLSFCGGEPLLFNGLDDIIKEAKSRHMVVNISTNGLLLEDKAEALIRAGVDLITVSVDSHDETLHDEMRGRAGLFRKIEKGIKAIRAFSRKSPVFIEARFLISKRNYRYLGDFVESFRGKVDSIVFKPVYTNANVSFDTPENMRFNPDDEYDFTRYFNDFLRRYKEFDTAYLREMPLFFFHPEMLNDRFVCFAGTFFGGIDSAGNLFPCHEMTVMPNIPAGNLRDAELADIWRGAGLDAVRSSFRAGRRCICWMDRFCVNIPLQRLLMPRHGM